MLGGDWLVFIRYPILYVSCQGICMLGTVVYIVYISPRAMRILGLYHSLSFQIYVLYDLKNQACNIYKYRT